MLPGPNYIYRCPECSNLLKRGSLESGNTFGAEIYSDGKMIAEMMPAFPNLTKCNKCNAILWLEDMRELGSCESWSYFCPPECDEMSKVWIEIFGKKSNEIIVKRNRKKPKCEYWGQGCNSESVWKNVEDDVEFLDIPDLVRALELGIVRREKYVRQEIWWAFNDRLREGKEIFIQEYDKTLWEENCRRFIKLLKGNKLLWLFINKKDVQRKLMIAELHRNLGEFDSCMKILNSIEDKNYAWVVEQLKIECENKNKLLVLLRPN